MSDPPLAPKPCPYCGGDHVIVCPRISALTYDYDHKGAQRMTRIEFHNIGIVPWSRPVSRPTTTRD